MPLVKYRCSETQKTFNASQLRKSQNGFVLKSNPHIGFFPEHVEMKLFGKLVMLAANIFGQVSIAGSMWRTENTARDLYNLILKDIQKLPA